MTSLAQPQLTASPSPWRAALPSRAALAAQGKRLRESLARGSHARWTPPEDRSDPLQLLEASNHGRVPELIPIRYGRMLQSPFTFFRGAAAIMAADLASTPVTGVRVQACGDCHLLNFGCFATPERRLLFDINDFDETLSAPWEWDVKRLAASFVIASRHNRFSAADGRDAAQSCVRAYRERMAEFAHWHMLDVWYASIDADMLIAQSKEDKVRKRFQKRIAKEAARDVLEVDFPKLVSINGGTPRIRDNPPLIYHLSEQQAPDFEDRIVQGYATYRETLQDDRRVLLDRYSIQDIAAKVVGVGSVGTLCAIVLLMADVQEPLFLQVKEARQSVLAPFAGASAYEHGGQRVVAGQRLMQSASDLFLGWTTDGQGRHFYVRQLRDMKITPLVELFAPTTMLRYAALCGWLLARAHARSGQPALISGYLGKSARFDTAIADFAVAYADQNERDYTVLQQAAREGRIEVYLER